MRGHLQKRQDWIRGRREKRKLARHARLRRQVFRYTLLTALVALAISGFTKLSWSLHNIQSDVYVQGNQVVTAEQVREMLSYVVSTPIYRLDPATMEAKVRELSPVRYAFVRRYLLPRPHIVVNVLEEVPWASYATTSDAQPEAVIAQTGKVIPISKFPRVAQPAMKICGEDARELKPQQIAEWENWVRLISNQTGRPVNVIDMRQPSAIVVKSGELNLHIGAADTTLTRRISRLSSVLPVLATLKDPVQYINLALDSNVPLKIDRNAPKKQDPAMPSAEAAAATSPSVAPPTTGAAPATASTATHI